MARLARPAEASPAASPNPMDATGSNSGKWLESPTVVYIELGEETVEEKERHKLDDVQNKTSEVDEKMVQRRPNLLYSNVPGDEA